MDADTTKDGSRKEKRKYGFKGKYCTKCNSVWEMIRREGESEDVQVSHLDFPSYGLEKQDYPECCPTI